MEPSRPASSCSTQAVTWAAWYDAWLLIISTPKAQSFLFFFLSTQAVSQALETRLFTRIEPKLHLPFLPEICVLCFRCLSATVRSMSVAAETPLRKAMRTWRPQHTGRLLH